jgi:hypothetical protein
MDKLSFYENSSSAHNLGFGSIFQDNGKVFMIVSFQVRESVYSVLISLFLCTNKHGLVLSSDIGQHGKAVQESYPCQLEDFLPFSKSPASKGRTTIPEGMAFWTCCEINSVGKSLLFMSFVSQSAKCQWTVKRWSFELIF